MNKAQIEQALQQALRRKGGSRMARLMRQPYRSIAPVLARRIGWSREV